MPRRQITRRKPVEVEVVEPLDPEDDFSDVSGDPGNGFRLLNSDPSRSYIWAHDSKLGISEYQANLLGYVVEKFTAGGVCPAGMEGFYQEGERIVVRDHVLMSCDRARQEKRTRFLASESRRIWGGKRNAVRDTEINAADAASAMPGGLRAALRSKGPVQTVSE